MTDIRSCNEFHNKQEFVFWPMDGHELSNKTKFTINFGQFLVGKAIFIERHPV